MTSRTAIVFLLAATACVGPEQIPPELVQTATVSTSSAVAVLPAEGTFQWLDNSGVLDETMRLEGQRVRDLDAELRDVIEAAIEPRGITYERFEEPDVRVGFYVVVGEIGAHSDVLAELGIDPGLHVRDTGFADGQATLLLQIVDGVEPIRRWQGAVQGLSHSELDPRVRRVRLEAVVGQLVAQIP